MTIKHIVISGGGPTGFITYGAVKYLAKENFWKLDDIKSIYGCSIGATLGVVLALGYDWDLLDDYFVKRPWDKVLGITPTSVIESLVTKGFVGEQFVKDSMEPLLTAKEIDINITLQEFYELNGIDIHLYSANINSQNIEKIDISHKSHPNLSLIKALCMSTAFPIIFQPVIDENNKCYIDGGILNNFPLNDCIEQTKCNENEILAFKNMWANNETQITENSNMMDFLGILVRKMQVHMSTEENQKKIKNTVRCLVDNLGNIKSWVNALSTSELRSQLIEKGVYQGKLFIDYINSNNDQDNQNNQDKQDNQEECNL